jgi:hypothetical protein
MADIIPPPPADFTPQNQWAWIEFYKQVRYSINNATNVTWKNLNFTNSNLTDIQTRNHNDLQNIQGGAATDYQHLTTAQVTGITPFFSLSGVGLAVRIGASSSATRSIAVSGTGLSVTNPTGAAGNPTITSNATNANTASTIVARDASGNFSAGTITATFSGQEVFATKAGDPTTSDITAGNGRIYKNTSTGAVKLWVNDGGTMKSVALA